MAVLNSCPGLEVKVIANKNALPEYADSPETDEQNTVTKFVEVDRDGAFQVHFQFTDAYTCRHGVRVELRLDGHKVDSCLYRQNQLKKGTGHTLAGARSKIRGRWHVSNFQFSQFVLDLNSRQELDQATLKRLKCTGVITVLIHRIKNIRNPRRSLHSTSDKPHGITKFERVPEKAVKDLGLSHHGRYFSFPPLLPWVLRSSSVARPKQEKPGVRSLSCSYVDGTEDKHAIAIFNFKYRSLGEPRRSVH
ncbi:hypothetical protein N0V86_005953 [Didymella sp. IMI 355093]|nr:hypothetical protein N0V86_005953 [Didymella sp. IMI 355093]